MSETPKQQAVNKAPNLGVERAWAWLIVVILVILGFLTTFAIWEYHDISLEDGVFNWNPRDGSGKNDQVDKNKPGGGANQPSGSLSEVNATTEPSGQAGENGEGGQAGADDQTNKTSPDPEQYLSWFLFSLLGTIFFLLSEVASWYPKIGKTVGGVKASFGDYLPWYFSNLVKGPLIVLLIMWILTNISFNLGGDGTETGDGTVGVGINFGELPSIVLIAFATMLGFYSRVARTQLDVLMRRILPAAWNEAYQLEGKLKIIGPAQINPGEEAAYTTSKAQAAVWRIIHTESISEIYLGIDNQELTVRALDQLNVPFGGTTLKIKATKLAEGQTTGKLVLRAELGEETDFFEVHLPRS